MKSTQTVTDPIFSIPPGPKGIFRWTIFQSLSTHLPLFQEPPQLGEITCFSISSSTLAFGTIHGSILLYSLSQKHQCTLVVGEEEDAVTSLSLKENFVLAGYASGSLRLWDREKRVLMKLVAPILAPIPGADGHVQGTRITFVFFSSLDKFYSADGEGCAFHHSFLSRLLYTTVKSFRIHGILSLFSYPSLGKIPNGDRYATLTTIHYMHPLSKSKRPNALDVFSLIAIASPVKIAILSMKPEPQIQWRMTWSGLAHSEKVTSAICKWWIPTSNPGTPLSCLIFLQDDMHTQRNLAFSYGPRLCLLVVGCRRSDRDPSKKKLTFEIGSKGVSIDGSDIVAIEWLNAQVGSLAPLTLSLSSIS
jgi:hypothetical protein